MSAQLAEGAAVGPAPLNWFTAHLTLAAGVSVTIHALSMTALQQVVAKLEGPAANDTPVPTTGKTKPTATPAPTPAPQAQPEGNAAATPPPASAPAAAGGSDAASDEPAITYDQVKDRVLKLSKISREVTLKTLGQFKGVNGQPVDHGNKLQLADYPAFVKAADEALK